MNYETPHHQRHWLAARYPLTHQTGVAGEAWEGGDDIIQSGRGSNLFGMKQAVLVVLVMWGLFLMGVFVGHVIFSSSGILAGSKEGDMFTEDRFTCGVFAEYGWEIEGSITCKKTTPLEITPNGTGTRPWGPNPEIIC